MAIHWDKHKGSSLSFSAAHNSQQTIGYLKTIIQVSPGFLGAIIGDNLYETVYFFITDFLLKQKALSSHQLDLLLREERAIIDKEHHEYLAYLNKIRQNEMSDVLTKLRDQSRARQEITLYQKQGLEVASTGMKKSISFQEAINPDIAIGYLGEHPSQKLGSRKLLDTEGQEYQEIIMAINCDKANNLGSYQSDSSTSLTYSLPQQHEKTIGYVRIIIQTNLCLSQAS